jgi:hypothetical protein
MREPFADDVGLGAVCLLIESAAQVEEIPI